MAENETRVPVPNTAGGPITAPADGPTSAPRAVTGYLMALATGSLWATLAVIGKLLVGTGADPVVLVGVRAALAFLMLAGALLLADRRLLRISWRDIPFFAIYGLSVAGNYGFYFLSLKYTGATMAVLFNYTYPAILACLAAAFLGERLDRAKVLAIVLTMAGCALVAQVYAPGLLQVNLKGMVFGLATALSGAVYAALSKKAVGRYDPWTLVVWGFGSGAIVLLATRAGSLGVIAHLPAAVWGGLLLAAVFPTLAAYALFTRALVYAEVTRVCIVASIEPAVAAILAWAFLGDRLAPLQWLGAAGVLAGVLLVQAVDLRRPAADPRAPRRAATQVRATAERK